MAERGDSVSKRYRALPREEPSSALDAAILAASRRAVGARPGGLRRWAGPLSIAAVLVLGIGVSLRMQLEQPGVESSVPSGEYSMPAAQDEGRVDKVTPAVPPPETPAETRAEAPPARAAPQALKRLAKPASPPAAAPSAAIESIPEALTAPQSLPSPPPPAQSAPAAPQSAPAASTMAPAAAPAPAMGARAKRESAAANESRAMDAAPDPLREELERIVRLRDEHRDDEADRALEEFRRKHPDYRIPEAMRERLRRH